MPNPIKIVLGATLAGLVAGAAAFAIWPSPPSATEGAATGAGIRRVIVINAGIAPMTKLVRSRLCGASPDCTNGMDNIDVTVFESGQMPQHAMNAVVQTDTNCMPDGYGISHCTNRLLLADGHTIEVRHDHNMARFPCLKPGETVRVDSEQPV